MSPTLANEMSTAHNEHGLPVTENLELPVEELLKRARPLPRHSADLSDTALIAVYEPIIVGRPAFLSFQTVAELRFGALRRGWGTARVRKLDAAAGTSDRRSVTNL